MSVVTTGSPTPAPAIQGPVPTVRDRIAAADHADRGRKPTPSWIWVLVEALAYAGASIDPTAALAAQRFARIRDQELGAR